MSTNLRAHFSSNSRRAPTVHMVLPHVGHSLTSMAKTRASSAARLSDGRAAAVRVGPAERLVTGEQERSCCGLWHWGRARHDIE